MAMRVRIFGKLSISLLFVIIFSVVLVTIGLAQPPGETPVTFPDANLEAAIRRAVEKPEGLIFTSDLDGLTSLEASGKIDGYGEPITDLTGLEHCINLSGLNLSWNDITDISPLASLTKLTTLDLNRNQISDISPLASLTELTTLDLGFNSWISEISPLANLTNLTKLSLYRTHDITQTSDISTLSSLTNLTELDLGENYISDISPLASLTKLTALNLQVNHISDISPLTNLTNLIELNLLINRISDISPLENLTSLTWLNLDKNQISDISPLLSLPSLKTLLILNDNPLSETSLNVYIPQLRKGGVSIPRAKKFIRVGRGEFLLIPLVAFIAALVITLRFYPTRGKRWRRLIKSGLIVGVVFTGLYTLYGTAEILFGGVYLEDLLFEVWIPGLALYGTMVVVAVITNVIAKKKA